MKISTILPTVFLISHASAFPSYASLRDRSNLKERLVSFDPVEQKVDVTGDHEFRAPGPNDLRGPCPGLNVLANHGYIQRNGIATLTGVISACIKVFGFGPDLAGALGGIGVALTGDPVTQTFSIGGQPPSNLLGSILLNTPQGLDNSHNTYESDSSTTRGDSYLYNGDASTIRVEYVKMVLDGSGGVDDYTPSGPWIAHRRARFEDSISKNPYFFFAPFSGLVSEAGVIFPRELYANRSAAKPDTGALPGSVLLSFWGCDKDATGQVTCTPGHERIPDNWYRRSSLNPFTIVGFLADVAELIVQYPRAGSIGGNTGTVNSFVGLDLGDLTGGVFQSGDLTDPNKLSCFIYQFTKVVTPSILKGLFTSTLAALNLLNTYFFSQFTGLNCPQLQSIDQSMFAQFPGAKPL